MTMWGDDDDDVDERATTMMSELQRRRASCEDRGGFNQLDFVEKAFNQLGFGLLCIGVWFWFSLYWGLVCFCSVLLVLGFGLLCK